MVKWTAHARIQLRHIHDYIAQDSKLYAKQVTRQLVQKSLMLNTLPRLGRTLPELNEDTVRELTVYSYRIVYEVKPTHIDILAVIHKRRDVRPDDIPRQ